MPRASNYGRVEPAFRQDVEQGCVPLLSGWGAWVAGRKSRLSTASTRTRALVGFGINGALSVAGRVCYGQDHSIWVRRIHGNAHQVPVHQSILGRSPRIPCIGAFNLLRYADAIRWGIRREVMLRTFAASRSYNERRRSLITQRLRRNAVKCCSTWRWQQPSRSPWTTRGYTSIKAIPSVSTKSRTRFSSASAMTAVRPFRDRSGRGVIYSKGCSQTVAKP